MQTRSMIGMWVLIAVSFCAFLVVFAFVHANVTLAGEMFDVNPECATPTDPLLRMIDELYNIWLAWGATGLLSWSCAFFANRIASVSTHWARRITSALLVLSSLTLIGLAFSIVFYNVTQYTTCIG